MRRLIVKRKHVICRITNRKEKNLASSRLRRRARFQCYVTTFISRCRINTMRFYFPPRDVGHSSYLNISEESHYTCLCALHSNSLFFYLSEIRHLLFKKIRKYVRERKLFFSSDAGTRVLTLYSGCVLDIVCDII